MAGFAIVYFLCLRLANWCSTCLYIAGCTNMSNQLVHKKFSSFLWSKLKENLGKRLQGKMFVACYSLADRHCAGDNWMRDPEWTTTLVSNTCILIVGYVEFWSLPSNVCCFSVILMFSFERFGASSGCSKSTEFVSSLSSSSSPSSSPDFSSGWAKGAK